MWVFGYGSLVWKADFPYEKRVTGYIDGYVRRFWQYSVDHRGVPSKARVWGAAYKISEKDQSAVMEHLDIREKNGYEKVDVMFYPASKHGQQDDSRMQHPFTVVLYLGTEQNEWFAGPCNEEEIARTVVSAVGPSGSNKEYVYNLASAMRHIASEEDDPHLFAVEAAVRKLDVNGIL